MIKHKICPACNSKNPEDEAMCCNCYVDISGANVIDDKEEKKVSNLENIKSAGKVCSKCGISSPDYAYLCEGCGTNISVITSNSTDSKKLILFSDSDHIELTISDGEIIGRCDRCANEFEKSISECNSKTGKLDFIDCIKFNTVSRKHLLFECENGCYYVKVHPEAKNATALNGQMLEKNNRYKLNNGDNLQVSSKLKLNVTIN